MLKRIIATIVLIVAAVCGCAAQTFPQITTQQVTFTGTATPVPVSQITANVVGQPGGQSYYIWVVAEFAVGNATPSAGLLVRNAPVALTSANYLNVSWFPVSGAVSYDVLLTTTDVTPSGACNCAAVVANAGTQYQIKTNTLQSYTVNTWSGSTAYTVTNPAAGLTFAGGSGTPLVLHPNGNADIYNTWANNGTIAGGAVNPKTLATCGFPAAYAGGDSGIRVNAAVTALPAGGGALCAWGVGTSTTATQIDLSGGKNIALTGGAAGATSVLNSTTGALGTTPFFGILKLGNTGAGTVDLSRLTFGHAADPGAIANDNGIVAGPAQRPSTLYDDEVQFSGAKGIYLRGNTAPIDIINPFVRENYYDYALTCDASSGGGCQNLGILGGSFFDTAGGISLAAGTGNWFIGQDIEGDSAGSIATHLPAINLSGSAVNLIEAGAYTRLAASTPAATVYSATGVANVFTANVVNAQTSGQTGINLASDSYDTALGAIINGHSSGGGKCVDNGSSTFSVFINVNCNGFASADQGVVSGAQNLGTVLVNTYDPFLGFIPALETTGDVWLNLVDSASGNHNFCVYDNASSVCAIQYNSTSHNTVIGNSATGTSTVNGNTTVNGTIQIGSNPALQTTNQLTGVGTTSPDNIVVASAMPLAGTVTITASNTALTAVTGAASITGATTSMACVASAAGTRDPDAFPSQCWVSSAGTVTVEVTTRVTDASPGAIVYQIRVIQ